MSEHGPGTWIQNFTILLHDNRFIFFYGNRTKKIINHDPFEKHQWVHHAVELLKRREISAVGLICCLKISLDFWLLETRGLVS